MKKNFIKRAAVLALSLIMVIGLLPTTVFADGTYSFYNGGNTSQIRWYVTDENAAYLKATAESGFIRFDLCYDEGWYFEKWTTWFKGNRNIDNWFDEEGINESNPSHNGYYLFFNEDQFAPFVNYSGLATSGTKWLNVSTYPFYGDMRIEAVLRPVLTVVAGDGVNFEIITSEPLTRTLASNQVAVKHGGTATIKYSADEKYITTKVESNYATNYVDNGSVVTVSSMIKPATIYIYSRLKQQIVNFNANGGEGTMSAQTFEHSVAQALTANAFTKTGYLFAGWNTAADGSGTGYADKASATFTPANDGDSITLYAQWTQCTSHTWEDGKCTKCGTLCSHSGGSATCTQQATCETCGESYGDYAKHNAVYSASENKIQETCTAGCGHSATAELVVDDTVSNVYTGSEIKGLKVVCSDDWQGGDLAITYTNNIKAGDSAGGSISMGEATATQTFTIAKKKITPVIVGTASKVYDGTDNVVGGDTYLTVDDSLAAGDSVGVGGSQKYEDANVGTNKAIIFYDIFLGEDEDAANYELATTTVSANVGTITKADATFTPPTANDVRYTGEMQELVTAGTANGGEMVFSLDKEGGYSDTLSAKNAGTYTVWYKVVGDGNHNDSVPASITAEIKKATPDLGTVSVSGTVYDTTSPADVVLTQTGTVPGTLKLTDAAMLANKTLYNYTFTPNDTTNYNSVSGQVAIDVQDTTAPTVSISVEEDDWTFWHTITFGLFYNRSAEVTITYADDENGSGLKEKLYYVADKEMTAEELQNVSWTAYTEAFDIDPDGKYAVYAKAVDNDGNTVTVNTDGYVVDSTPAVVEGLTNGGIYYGQLVFTVADALSGVSFVNIDGNAMTPLDGQYVMDADNAEHTVAVMDKAGNLTEYKVTVYKNYTVTYNVNGEVIGTQTVGHGKDAAAPAIPAKDGYIGKWDADGKNITGDTTINAVYTAIPASPLTADTGDLWLWMVLLSISGGAVIALSVVNRKRRYTAKY